MWQRAWLGALKRVPEAMVVFFFQAEDGIRDWSVTGVQTCALPIYRRADIGANQLHIHIDCIRADVRAAIGRNQAKISFSWAPFPEILAGHHYMAIRSQIGRASCRERGEISGRAVCSKRKEERVGVR